MRREGPLAGAFMRVVKAGTNPGLCWSTGQAGASPLPSLCLFQCSTAKFAGTKKKKKKHQTFFIWFGMEPVDRIFLKKNVCSPENHFRVALLSLSKDSNCLLPSGVASWFFPLWKGRREFKYAVGPKVHWLAAMESLYGEMHTPGVLDASVGHGPSH